MYYLKECYGCKSNVASLVFVMLLILFCGFCCFPLAKWRIFVTLLAVCKCIRLLSSLVLFAENCKSYSLKLDFIYIVIQKSDPCFSRLVLER